MSLTSLYHIFFVVFIMVAVVAQFIFKHPQNFTDFVSFFSYFTILSNLLIAFVFVAQVFKKKSLLGISIEAIRPAAVVYMVLTGLVVALLLEKYASLALELPFANDVLHKIIPIAAFLDWVFIPPKHRINPKVAFKWLVFPLVFAAVCLWRGSLINWYPYPFLDPAITHGYLGVFAYIIGLSVGVFAISQVIIYIGNTGASRKK